MSRAAQFEQGGTSRAAGDDEEDGDESTSSAMDISGSRGMPPPHPPCAHGAQAFFSSTREREHHGHWQEMDQLANGMGELRTEQEATFDVVQQNAQLIEALEQQNRQWAGWWEFYPPPHPGQ